MVNKTYMLGIEWGGVWFHMSIAKFSEQVEGKKSCLPLSPQPLLLPLPFLFIFYNIISKNSDKKK